MEISPSDLPWRSVYKLMSGSILPRPVGWVSTVDTAGRPNLAPFSFFNMVCAKPPTLLFCPIIRTTDGQPKDTLNNVRATGEFVINIVTESLAGAVNQTAIEAPPGFNEFEYAGLTPVPAVRVRPPRVAESPIHFECRLTQIVDVSGGVGGGAVVLGEVLHIHVAEHVLEGEDRINLQALQPVGRLVGNLYCRVSDTFSLDRPSPSIPPRRD